MEANGVSLPVVVSGIVMILVGLIGIFRGWQMHYQKRLDLISDWDGKPLPNPDAHTRAFFLVYLSGGLILCLLPLLLPLGVRIIFLGALIAVTVWAWFTAIDVIAARSRKAPQPVADSRSIPSDAAPVLDSN